MILIKIVLIWHSKSINSKIKEWLINYLNKVNVTYIFHHLAVGRNYCILVIKSIYTIIKLWTVNTAHLFALSIHIIIISIDTISAIFWVYSILNFLIYSKVFFSSKNIIIHILWILSNWNQTKCFIYRLKNF